MRRILEITSILMLLSGGVAVAGPHGGGGGGAVVRDHRGGGGYGGGGGGVVVRDHRGGWGGGGGGGVVVRDHRGYGGPVYRGGGPVRVTGGRYMFPGGVVRVYNRPVIREHYYSYDRRPALIVENYDPVPGDVWIPGNWTWNGVEWIWAPGYWAVGGGAGVSVGASVVVD